MVDFNFDKVEQLTLHHPKPLNLTLSCGTAGFRSLATNLDHIFFRVGLLATLRAKFKNAVIGVMATASHNPIVDNGVKIIDPLGEMLEQAWEKFAETIGNANDVDLVNQLKKVIQACEIDLSIPATIFIGMDTRPSSKPLCVSLKEGITAIGGCYKEFGVLTTPQLHYIVNRTNTNKSTASEDGYYDEFCGAFINTIKGNNDAVGVTVDCANGVGALKLKVVSEKVKKQFTISLTNDGDGELNKECGADYVKMQQRGPIGMSLQKNAHFASFDGDGDRIVYYTVNDEDKFLLLDGDKMACLIALYFKEALEILDLSCNLGLIQTAYANGNSTKYATDVLGIEVACTKTGVKHLHHKAQDFDIGIYFEPNGHGTVLIKNNVLEDINKQQSNNQMKYKASELLNVISIINQTVGDSICDLLLIEAILLIKSWSILEWNDIYTELPNRQLKVKVKDRTAVKTTSQETEVVEPCNLQEKINETVKKFPSGRSFVRPSGTEDVVRVYAESDTRENADQLAQEIAKVVEAFL